MSADGVDPLPPPAAAGGRSGGPAEGAAADEESPRDRRKRRIELAGAIIIGIAAVLTAVATYQGSQVDGTVQAKSTEAVSLTLIANDLYSEGTAREAEERDWFFAFLTAAARDEEATSSVFFRTMPADVQQLTDEWLLLNDELLIDDEAPIDDPFFTDEDGVSVLASFEQLESTLLEEDGDEVDLLAECALFDSEVARTRGDGYRLSTVFLAIALVVGGIAALLKGKAAQIIVLVTSVLSLLLGVGVLVIASDDDRARQEAAVEFFRGPDGASLPDGVALAQADAECPAGEE